MRARWAFPDFQMGTFWKQNRTFSLRGKLILKELGWNGTAFYLYWNVDVAVEKKEKKHPTPKENIIVRSSTNPSEGLWNWKKATLNFIRKKMLSKRKLINCTALVVDETTS